MLRSVALIVWILLVAFPATSQETARALLDRCKALDHGERHWNDRHAKLHIRIADRSGGARSRDLEVFDKRYPGDEAKTIMFLSAPAEVRGTGFLSFTHRGAPADQWLLLPELQRVRQITSNTRQQSFVGTDLTYHDLDLLTEMIDWTEADSAADLHGEEDVDGERCWVIEFRPKRADIGYKKILLWLAQSDLFARRLDFFADDPNVVTKRVYQRDVRTVRSGPVAYRTDVATPALGSSTSIEIVGIELDRGLSDDLFTQGALEHGPP